MKYKSQVMNTHVNLMEKEAVAAADHWTIEEKAENTASPSDKNEGTTEYPVTVPIPWYFN